MTDKTDITKVILSLLLTINGCDWVIHINRLCDTQRTIEKNDEKPTLCIHQAAQMLTVLSLFNCLWLTVKQTVIQAFYPVW